MVRKHQTDYKGPAEVNLNVEHLEKKMQAFVNNVSLKDGEAMVSTYNTLVNFLASQENPPQHVTVEMLENWKESHEQEAEEEIDDTLNPHEEEIEPEAEPDDVNRTVVRAILNKKLTPIRDKDLKGTHIRTGHSRSSNPTSAPSSTSNVRSASARGKFTDEEIQFLESICTQSIEHRRVETKRLKQDLMNHEMGQEMLKKYTTKQIADKVRNLYRYSKQD